MSADAAEDRFDFALPDIRSVNFLLVERVGTIDLVSVEIWAPVGHDAIEVVLTPTPVEGFTSLGRFRPDDYAVARKGAVMALEALKATMAAMVLGRETWS